MKTISLKKQPDKKITLFTMGLNLEVQPYWLVQQLLNKNSQGMLDEMIASKFKEALHAFDKWEREILELIGDNDPDDVFIKHKREKHIQQIQDVADISRNLLPLHSDWECIDTTEEEKRP